MYEPNLERVLALLQPSDVVLDIGGWGRPFNRANYVIDAEPFDTRLTVRAQGGDRECFTRETWIQRDVCDRAPFPFADKEIDFAVCSHTLEDIRDPLGVCGELVRVARRGYVEVPSRLLETCRGIESPRQVGYTHHRWLVDIEDNGITFLAKPHVIHSHWRFSFPPSFLRRLPVQRHFQWLFWEGSFAFAERRPFPVTVELERFVQEHRPYPAWRLACARGCRQLDKLMGDTVNGFRGRLGGLPGSRESKSQ